MSGMAGGTPEPAPAPAPESSGGSKQMSQAEIEAMMSSMAGGAPEPAPASAPESSGGSKQMTQAEIEAMMSGMAGGTPAPAPQPAPVPQAAPAAPQAAPQMPPQMAYPPQGMPMPGMGVPPGYMPMYYPYPPAPVPQAAVEPKVINTKPVALPKLEGIESLGKEQAENLDLIMEVPLQITVEIGRTRRKVQEILEFTKGSLVVLDKLAGDQVDLFVNGKCVAKGDVVVIDDNFGVRITEIVRNPSVEELTQNKR